MKQKDNPDNTFFKLDFSKNDFLKDCETPNPIQRSIMPVVKEIDGKFTALGTAFCISNKGLMLTAMHVVSETLTIKHSDSEVFPSYTPNSNTKLYVLYSCETICK